MFNSIAKPHARAKEPCAECGTEIVGKVLTALGQSFHPKCFSCTQCSKGLAEEGHKSFFIRNNRVWCPKCRTWSQREKGISGASDVEYPVDIQQLFQESSSPWATPVTVKCIGCQLPIQGTVVLIDRAKYHPACVKCDQCGISLPNGHVKVAGRPFCTVHATAAKESRGQKTDYIPNSSITYAGETGSVGSSSTIAQGIRYNQVTREVTTGPSIYKASVTAATSASSAPAKPAAAAPAATSSSSSAAAARSSPARPTSAAAPTPTASNKPTTDGNGPVCGKCGAPRPATGNAFGGQMKFCQGCGAKF